MPSSLSIPTFREDDLLKSDAQNQGFELVPYAIPENLREEIRSFITNVFVDSMGFSSDNFKIFEAENSFFVGVLLNSMVEIKFMQSRMRGFFNEKGIDTQKLRLPTRSELGNQETPTQKLLRKRRESGQKPSASEESGIWRIPKGL